jgi:hypothetical protein
MDSTTLVSIVIAGALDLIGVIRGMIHGSVHGIMATEAGMILGTMVMEAGTIHGIMAMDGVAIMAGDTHIMEAIMAGVILVMVVVTSLITVLQAEPIIHGEAVMHIRLAHLVAEVQAVIREVAQEAILMAGLIPMAAGYLVAEAIAIIAVMALAQYSVVVQNLPHLTITHHLIHRVAQVEALAEVVPVDIQAVEVSLEEAIAAASEVALTAVTDNVLN